MRVDGNAGGGPNYWPNSFGGPEADQDYDTRVAEGLGLDVNEVKRLADMSQEDRVKATVG
jgi:hypothetical protein